MPIKYLTRAIPVLLSTKGYGLLWDNHSASHFYGGEEGNTKFKHVSESRKIIDYYFFYWPEFDRVINLYREAAVRLCVPASFNLADPKLYFRFQLAVENLLLQFCQEN